MKITTPRAPIVVWSCDKAIVIRSNHDKATSAFETNEGMDNEVIEVSTPNSAQGINQSASCDATNKLE